MGKLKDKILKQVQDDSKKKKGILRFTQDDKESNPDDNTTITTNKKDAKCKNCLQKENECEEYKQGWQRALADYDNLKKEVSEKKSELYKMSELQILVEFLPVYEHLKMSIYNEQVAASKDPWVEGVKYVLKQFTDILDQHGIEEIKTVGEQFDPSLHEAVSEEESNKFEEGTIIKEIKSGYLFGEKVLSAAQVIVSKKAAISQ